MDVILTSTVIAAIVAGFVAAWTAQRKIGIENITQDRRSWREKVRGKSLTVHDAIISRDKESLDKLRVEFMAILNPEDKDDGAIISCISLPEEGKELERAEEFAERIALLLKHDWERVKLEAGPLVMRVKVVRDWVGKISYKPARVRYEKKR
ncbi:hypothetical protein [Azoarcus olearius]|uniref:hypothetical protein n=1 Tax=Azoarcus sp. (strain BH72) TaxID=418699 RepID=UPI000806847E|nr:hypothetical protein [Azoarcus olearius]